MYIFSVTNICFPLLLIMMMIQLWKHIEEHQNKAVWC